MIPGSAHERTWLLNVSQRPVNELLSLGAKCCLKVRNIFTRSSPVHCVLFLTLDLTAHALSFVPYVRKSSQTSPVITAVCRNKKKDHVFYYATLVTLVPAEAQWQEEEVAALVSRLFSGLNFDRIDTGFHLHSLLLMTQPGDREMTASFLVKTGDCGV